MYRLFQLRIHEVQTTSHNCCKYTIIILCILCASWPGPAHSRWRALKWLNRKDQPPRTCSKRFSSDVARIFHRSSVSSSRDATNCSWVGCRHILVWRPSKAQNKTAIKIERNAGELSVVKQNVFSWLYIPKRKIYSLCFSRKVLSSTRRAVGHSKILRDLRNTSSYWRFGYYHSVSRNICCF